MICIHMHVYICMHIYTHTHTYIYSIFSASCGDLARQCSFYFCSFKTMICYAEFCNDKINVS